VDTHRAYDAFPAAASMARPERRTVDVLGAEC
jgi:hypothetical protein